MGLSLGGLELEWGNWIARNGWMGGGLFVLSVVARDVCRETEVLWWW